MPDTLPIVRHDGAVAVRTSTGPLPLRQIIGIGRNYADHAKEMGGKAEEHPVVFMKNPAALAIPGEDIVIPAICQDRDQTDFEGELAVIIGTAARDVPHARALAHVLGYCPANDVSARWWQKQGSGGQFNRGKSFDTFCPIGPHVTPAAAVRDPQALTITTTVSGERMQHGSTADMLFTVATLIADLSRGMTLLPGTVILTGTPAGVGAGRTPPRFLRDGDTVSVEITGMGTLTNKVRLER